MGTYHNLGCRLSSTNWHASFSPTFSSNCLVSRKLLTSNLMMWSLFGFSGDSISSSNKTVLISKSCNTKVTQPAFTKINYSYIKATYITWTRNRFLGIYPLEDVHSCFLHNGQQLWIIGCPAHCPYIFSLKFGSLWASCWFIGVFVYIQNCHNSRDIINRKPPTQSKIHKKCYQFNQLLTILDNISMQLNEINWNNIVFFHIKPHITSNYSECKFWHAKIYNLCCILVII